ncbi:HlyD family secretion protein [Bradyrhizobium sp. INPA01-394B]|uniref:HlyD family secretion protein n=2 Tax=Bradyrhizobium campsiandrae TaxID=1729892 RepID=A0ABR7U6J4_9BRAD|nr:HlyD family secretion protein [Bradyrhizobium campsiandrae]MBC9979047.1 HlyD family secretion protein [Bradyrhizobium campsiandrae]
MLLAGLGCVLVLVGGFYAIQWLRWRATHVSENDARVEGEVVTMASRLDGWLVARPVIEGDPVKKGQVVAQIDDRDARLRLHALEASLAAADAQIQQSIAQRDTTEKITGAAVDDAQAQIVAQEATVASAQHQLELAEVNFNREDQLLKSGNTPKKTWDEAQSTFLQRQDDRRQAEAQLLSHKAALESAQAQRGQLAVLDRQIDVQRQQRQTLAAQADQLRQEIADRRLVSPVDGMVDKTLAEVGNFVQAGQWVMMVHDPDNVWVEAEIKETAIGSVAVGQPVEVTVDAYPDLVLHGRVLRVGNAATNQFALLPSPNPSGNFTKITQRVPVRIALDRHDARLKPGLMVEVSIDVPH